MSGFCPGAHYSLEIKDVLEDYNNNIAPKVERRKNNRLGLLKNYRDRYSVGDLICGTAIAVLPMIVITILALAFS
jgi:hypothetical protein